MEGGVRTIGESMLGSAMLISGLNIPTQTQAREVPREREWEEEGSHSAQGGVKNTSTGRSFPRHRAHRPQQPLSSLTVTQLSNQMDRDIGSLGSGSLGSGSLGSGTTINLQTIKKSNILKRPDLQSLNLRKKQGQCLSSMSLGPERGRGETRREEADTEADTGIEVSDALKARHTQHRAGVYSAPASIETAVRAVMIVNARKSERPSAPTTTLALTLTTDTGTHAPEISAAITGSIIREVNTGDRGRGRGSSFNSYEAITQSATRSMNLLPLPSLHTDTRTRVAAIRSCVPTDVSIGGSLVVNSISDLSLSSRVTQDPLNTCTSRVSKGNLVFKNRGVLIARANRAARAFPEERPLGPIQLSVNIVHYDS